MSGPFNTDRVRAQHDTFMRRLDAAFERSLSEAAAFAERYTTRDGLGFKHRSGRLGRSTRARIIRTARGRLLKISNAAPYARAIERGTRPRRIEARGRALAFQWRGRLNFYRSVWHPGTRATHFLRNTTNRTAAELGRILRAELDRLERFF